LETTANPWDDIPIKLMYDVFEPALQEYVTLTVTVAENPRGHVLDTSAKWVIRQADIEDIPNGVADVTIEVEGLASSLPGAGDYTGEEVPIPDPDGPPTPPPPDPPPPDEPPPPPVTPGTGDWVVVGTVGGAGVCYTKNAVSGVPPTWYQLNTGLANLDPIEWLSMDPTRPFRLVCIDGDGDVYTNVSWQSGGSWQKVLDVSDVVAADPDVSALTLGQVYCGALQNGEVYIVAVGEATYLGVGATLTYWSLDFGGSWTMVPMKYGKHGGFSDSPTCEYTNESRYWAIWDRTNQVTSGQFLPLEGSNAETIAIGGRCTASGSQGRSNVASFQAGGWNGLFGDYHPSWTTCPSEVMTPGVISKGVGGSGASNFDWNGPLAMCVNRVTGLIYYASWKVHEDLDVDEPLTIARTGMSVAPGGTFLSYSGEITRGLGDMPGMMFAPPIGISSVEWVGMRAYTDPGDALPYTDLYKGPNISDGQVTIAGRWRYGYSFPTLVDTIWAITYLGRSYKSGGKADASDPRVFLVGKNTAVNYAEAFADHTGNLYSLGATGITNICPDPTR
jgi:hypothetical protein